MSEVDELIEVARDTLYDGYNKKKYDEYTQTIENCIIMENFLRRADLALSTAVEKSTVSEQGF